VTRYELLDRIGVGGMAEIFRGKAVAAGGFEKPVAIKRILPHLSQDKRFVELLIAEAKVLSLLKHRNIVQIFDVGLGDDAQYFLVMEYVDGKDLGAVQRAVEGERRRIPFDLALHVGAEICEALEHAHSARAPDGKPMSLVHRDVSPSNVLVSRAGEVKLTDFGIAKRAESEQTGSGAVRGKFAYISPEQARNEHIDPRSDVFSAAVLVWELVTGKRLFSGLGDLEALRAVREAQARRPTEADPRLDPRIDALLMPALAKDAQRRPTAGQFAEQLRGLRYSLDSTSGDPATELAKIIDNAAEAEKLTVVAAKDNAFEPELTGATVIRIHTADAFAGPSDISVARQVIDRFEEEETRLASLTGDQLRMLRSTNSARDSADISTSPGPSTRNRTPTDEPTRAGAPLDDLDGMTVAQDPSPAALASMRDGGFDIDESTRLVAPSSRRTPAPERIPPRANTSTPAAPARPRAPTAPPVPTARPRANTSTPAPSPAIDPHPQPIPPTGARPNERRPATLPPPFSAQPSPGPIPPTPFGTHPAPGHVPPAPFGSQPPPMFGGPPPGPQAPYGQPQPYPTWQRPQEPMYPPHLPPRTGLQPWMLVVGAVVMALLAFAVTRAFIGG
jgi:serine/threonine-protein kinase